MCVKEINFKTLKFDFFVQVQRPTDFSNFQAKSQIKKTSQQGLEKFNCKLYKWPKLFGKCSNSDTIANGDGARFVAKLFRMLQWTSNQNPSFQRDKPALPQHSVRSELSMFSGLFRIDRASAKVGRSSDTQTYRGYLQEWRRSRRSLSRIERERERELQAAVAGKRM